MIIWEVFSLELNKDGGTVCKGAKRCVRFLLASCIILSQSHIYWMLSWREHSKQASFSIHLFFYIIYAVMDLGCQIVFLLLLLRLGSLHRKKPPLWPPWRHNIIESTLRWRCGRKPLPHPPKLPGNHQPAPPSWIFQEKKWIYLNSLIKPFTPFKVTIKSQKIISQKPCIDFRSSTLFDPFKTHSCPLPVTRNSLSC